MPSVAFLNDTWEWDGTRWKEIRMDGPLPSERAFLSAAFDVANDRMMVFSGWGGSNDVWLFKSRRPPLVNLGHVVSWPTVDGAMDLVLESSETLEGPWMEYQAERGLIGDDVVVPIEAADRSKFFRTREP